MSTIIKKLIKVFLFIVSYFDVKDKDTIKPIWDSEDLEFSTDIAYGMFKETVIVMTKIILFLAVCVGAFALLMLFLT
jgi:hypothetical protein